MLKKGPTAIQPIILSQERDGINALNSISPMDILLEVMQKLSLAMDLETIMYIVRRAARKLMESDGATFVLRENNQCFYADEDAIAPLWKGKRFPMSACVSGWVMENSQHTIIDNIYTDSRIPLNAYRSTFVKSLAMVPIRKTSPIGAIGAYWAEYYHPTEKQITLLQMLADSTSVAMQNIHLNSELNKGQKETSAQIEITQQLRKTNEYLESTLKELNRRNEEILLLKEFSSSLQSCLYIEEAYQLIQQYMMQLIPECLGVLYLMHPSHNYLESVSSWGNTETIEKIMKPEECFALRRGVTYKTDYSQPGLTCPHKSKEHKKPSICLPLYAQSDILGLLYFEFKKEQLTHPDILIDMIAEQISLGISNIKLRETLRNQSFRDALTNLYNRRYLEETLEREISRCERKTASLALLMIDIDHFKPFNDQFGHEAGDMVIQSFAKVLQHSARKSDIACRYGGEEFILVLPETELATVIHHAELLHEAVSSMHVRYNEMILPSITISIGIAIIPNHARTMKELITISDKALYEAKNSGRNKTVLYQLNNEG